MPSLLMTEANGVMLFLFKCEMHPAMPTITNCLVRVCRINRISLNVAEVNFQYLDYK